MQRERPPRPGNLYPTPPPTQFTAPLWGRTQTFGSHKKQGVLRRPKRARSVGARAAGWQAPRWGAGVGIGVKVGKG